MSVSLTTLRCKAPADMLEVKRETAGESPTTPSTPKPSGVVRGGIKGC